LTSLRHPQRRHPQRRHPQRRHPQRRQPQHHGHGSAPTIAVSREQRRALRHSSTQAFRRGSAYPDEPPTPQHRPVPRRGSRQHSPPHLANARAGPEVPPGRSTGLRLRRTTVTIGFSLLFGPDADQAMRRAAAPAQDRLWPVTGICPLAAIKSRPWPSWNMSVRRADRRADTVYGSVPPAPTQSSAPSRPPFRMVSQINGPSASTYDGRSMCRREASSRLMSAYSAVRAGGGVLLVLDLLGLPHRAPASSHHAARQGRGRDARGPRSGTEILNRLLEATVRDPSGRAPVPG